MGNLIEQEVEGILEITDTYMDTELHTPYC